MASINQTTEFATATATDIFEVPLLMATADSLEGYGRIVHSFEEAEVDIVPWPLSGWRKLIPGTGIEGGLAQDTFEFEWKESFLYATNHAVRKSYITGMLALPGEPMPKDRKAVLVREANYHPDGGQVFFPKNGEPFVALLALPGDDVRPEDFRAFYCDGSFGIHINPNVWHQPVYPIADKATFDDKQGKVHGCVLCDFVEEFNCWLSVPLSF
ncbi:MAG: ureidoglycolate lyase [Chitinophagales bacterium]|nr:ureidoglycolate lyase [Chitinophagales bacterium]